MKLFNTNCLTAPEDTIEICMYDTQKSPEITILCSDADDGESAAVVLSIDKARELAKVILEYTEEYVT